MDKIIEIKLDSTRSVHEFCKTINGLPWKFEIVSGRYIINAKSFMGVCSMDLSMPLQLRISTNKVGINTVRKKLKAFIVDPSSTS